MPTPSSVLVVSIELSDARVQREVSLPAVEPLVDASIDEFNEYFQRVLKNDPLIPSERAILKTYLGFALSVAGQRVTG